MDRVLIFICCLYILSFFNCTNISNNSNNSVSSNNKILCKNDTYKMLNEILEDKKQQLIEYMEIVQSKANSIQNDDLMYSFFKAKKEYYQMLRNWRTYISSKV